MSKKKKIIIWIISIAIVLGITMTIFIPKNANKEEFHNYFREYVDENELDVVETAVENRYNYLYYSVYTVKNYKFIAINDDIIEANDGGIETFAKFSMWIPQLILASRVTISLSVLALIAGLIFGVILALGKISKNKFISKISSIYIFIFRGTPLIMQLFFIYYALPQISLSLKMDGYMAAFLAFSLNSAAYCAEIIRAGIQSIDKGQMEAAKALGMGRGKAMRLIIIPQTYRRLIPPVGNEFIMLLKDVSLVSIIAIGDILKITRSVQSTEANALIFLPAAGIYLCITAIFTFIFNKIETKLSVYE